MKVFKVKLKGGPGSGHWGHVGRPGQRGGGRASGTNFRPANMAPPLLTSTIAAEESAKADSILNAAIGVSSTGHSYAPLKYTSWDNSDVVKGGDVKRNIVANLSEATGIPEEEVNEFIGQWAETSNDTDMRSLAIQEDASKAFGVPLSDWQKEQIKENRYIAGISPDGDTNAKYKSLLESSKQQAVLKEMYKQTQADLQKKGFKPGDTVLLYRGVSDPSLSTASGIVSYRGNAIESWSAGPHIAASFAQGNNGIVVSMRVPIENIVGTAVTGFGCLGEGEFVIIGSLLGQVARIEDIYEE